MTMEDFDFVKRPILIVEDEPVNRLLLAGMLEENYEILQAADGREAMRYIEKGEDIALILLDLLMPNMNGYEVLRALRERKLLTQIPVIVLTSETSAEVQSLNLGAIDFIPKPYDAPEVIRARVRRIIQMSEDSAALRRVGQDPLTGLFVPSFFFRRIERIERYAPDRVMDAMAINVNNFHLINNLYGRACGDDVLLILADALKNEMEACLGVACREHGDNFYLYMEHHANPEDMLIRIADGVRQRAGIKTLRLRMGVYPEVDRKVSMEDRFARAEHACQTLRGNYTRRVAVYDEEMFHNESFANNLLESFDEALAEGQFQVWYQPQYDIRGDVPVLSGAEALVRWLHPRYGMVRPDKFIPLFEANGLIARLDRLVWHTAASQVRKWHDEYGSKLSVSVNVSRISIRDPRLEEDLLDIAQHTGIHCRDLVLEVTESAYADSMEQLVNTVGNLRANGFLVEMDDFGSGYSSLNMLTSLPMDALKVDMKLIRHITDSEKDLHVLTLILDIARSLALPVVAEGVETQAQFDLLKQLGCDRIQGYYFSKPVTAFEFSHFLVQPTGKPA
ncbi:MAG: EAL domain-containing protein [Desulfovibrio sp.]|nr:EAL domain-containing protein [Desulfovibrio sp.]